MIRQVISGGQDGVDVTALMVAQSLNISTGGYCPKGYRTESGPKPELKDFGLIETKTSAYDDRTAKNILKSDCTIIFYESLKSPGTKLTINLAERFGRPYVLINIKRPPDPLYIVKWLQSHNHDIINVAGHRESVCPGIGKFVELYLPKILTYFINTNKVA